MSEQPLIGPQPQYPTPWRVAETRGNQVVIACAEGHYAAYVPSAELAELIVHQINVAADDGVTS
jgi:hypothetical protein